MPDFEPLGSLMMSLHQEFVRIYYLMLPAFFALSIAVTWIQSPHGSIEFIDVLKRAFVSTERIDQVNGLDTFLRMAQEKTINFTFAKNVLLLNFPDLLIALLTMYHFYLHDETLPEAANVIPLRRAR